MQNKERETGVNKISPKKLLNSKWTAVVAITKQKHFIVTEIEFDEQQNVIVCVIQAVMTKYEQNIDWRDLKDSEKWLQGWK